MAIQVKSADVVAQKWAQRAGAAAGDYQNGINTPRRDQAQASIDAAPVWGQAVTAAAQNDSYAKGINRVGSGKWKRNALAKGVTRFQTGVQAAQPDMARGIGPVLDVIKNVDLPPRMPRGNPANLQRVAAIANALRAAKLGGF